MAATTAGVIGAGAAVGSTVASIKQGADAKKAAGRARSDAAALREQGLEIYDDLLQQIPSVNERLYNLERLKQVGELTPEMEAAIAQEETELNKILLDPRFRQQQMKAMDKINEIVDSEGLDPIAKAQLQKIQSEVNNINKARQGAILQQAAAQGRLTSGSTLTAQLLAAQDAATREADMGSQAAADQYKRYTDSIGQSSDMATSLRNQEYGEQADIAKAQDAINSFNVQQSSNVNQRNVDRSNLAQQANLSEQQRVADANVAASREEARNKVDATQNYYKDLEANKMAKSNVLMGEATQKDTQASQSAAQGRASDAAVVGGLGKIGGTLIDYGIGNYGDKDKTKDPTKT